MLLAVSGDEVDTGIRNGMRMGIGMGIGIGIGIGIGKDRADPVDASTPHICQLVQQPMGLTQGVRAAANSLLPALPLLGDQPSLFQDRHMFLHGRETHREPPREVRDRVLTGQGESHDLAPRRIGQGMKDAIGSLGRLLIYNH